LNAFAAGFEAAHERLRGRWAAGIVAVSTILVVVSAAILHRDSPADAADLVLSGVVFGLTVPIVAYAAVARACRYGRLDDGVAALTRYGADRRLAVAGLVAGTGVRVAIVAAGLGAIAAVVAHGGLARDSASDALVTGWVGALGGASYSGLLSLASLFGRRGGGRGLALLADAIFGMAASAVALPWPRAHLRSLLGGGLVEGLAERQSAALLAGLCVAWVAVCLIRVPR